MDSAVVPSIPLIPSDEERLLREAVAGIASSYGPAYIKAKHEAGLPPSELWDALAEKGYLGVNIPATASPRSTASATMPLNDVAEHSLGLPRSY